MIADELRALAVHLWPNAILHAEILALADRVEAVERDATRMDLLATAIRVDVLFKEHLFRVDGFRLRAVLDAAMQEKSDAT